MIVLLKLKEVLRVYKCIETILINSWNVLIGSNPNIDFLAFQLYNPSDLVREKTSSSTKQNVWDS